jgi:hypothetical protein
MARPCTVCGRPDAGRINELLRSGRSARAVAGEYAVGYAALTRHARNHLSRPEIANGAADLGDLDPLDELVMTLRARALAGSDAASREYRLALAAQATARHAMAPTRALADSDEWIVLRTTMLKALAPFPGARIAIADALAVG